MRVETVRIFIADDGTRFDNKLDCKKYECAKYGHIWEVGIYVDRVNRGEHKKYNYCSRCGKHEDV